jgi:hypothetical protein
MTLCGPGWLSWILRTRLVLRPFTVRPLAVRSLVLLLTSALLASSAHAGSNSVPDWVLAAAHEDVPPLPGSPRAVVLLSETTYTVAPDGKAVEHVREVVKVLRQQGRQDATPHVFFDKDSKIVSFHVWAIDPQGHPMAVKDDAMMETTPDSDGQLYEDIHIRFVNPPGADPGGVVAWEYEQRERPYIAETTWEFQDDLPHIKQSFLLRLPQGFSQASSWAHHAALAGRDIEHGATLWQMDNTAAVDLESVPLAPAEDAIAARMTVHYWGAGLAEPREDSWQGIGEWYDDLSHSQLAADPAITAMAAELTAGKTDFFEKASALGTFVQQKTRYFSIELGVGGYKPHSAAEVFSKRYGDCKDKATLLVSMLSTVGIHADLLMVDTNRGTVDASAPSLEGNHMIVAIEVPAGYESPKLHSLFTAPNGKRYFAFDPTWFETPFGQIEDNLQGSTALLVEGAQSGAIVLPVMPPGLNKITRAASFDLAASGALHGSVTDTRFGDVAEDRRIVFTHDDAKDQQKYLDGTVSRDFAAATLTDVKVENAADPRLPLTLSYAVAVPEFATSMGPLLLVRPRVLGSFGPEVDSKPRQVAIDLGETFDGSDSFTIRLPPGYTVDDLPVPVKLDTGFASYESSTEVRDGALVFHRHYIVRQLTLPASRYGEVQHLAAVISADEHGQAVLKKQ